MGLSKIRVLLGEHTNPWFNLATEDYIFRDMSPDTHILFLWRNSPTVVIGRFQNPWSECNVEAMDRDGIFLARRQSGGGAVFHDLGNTNFTFMSGKPAYNKQRNNQIITSALAKFGIHAETSGRNDIVVDGRKISGAAFKETKDRAFHHGTLLINADLGRLGHYLNPQKRKLETKGIASVRSRVANLTEFNASLSHEQICKMIIDQYFLTYDCHCEVETLDNEKLQLIPELMNYYQKLSSWDWRFGETPKFTHHIDLSTSFGHFDFHFFVEKGIVSELSIFSDCLDVELIPELLAMLKNRPYDQIKEWPTLPMNEQNELRVQQFEELWGVLRARL